MIWDFLDKILRFFDLFPNSRKEDESTDHFKNFK